MMFIDHVFIFTDDQGDVANSLLGLGFVEGSNRIHDGQGTSNRKFYFDNFFLEIIWVHDKQEITSKKALPMGLWKRAEFRNRLCSPFGLCIMNQPSTDKLFSGSSVFQPAYFPAGMPIDIIKNEHQDSLPYTFRLPFKVKKPHDEPKQDWLDIHYLTKAIFEYTDSVSDDYLSYFNDEEQIEFVQSDRHWLTLVFDNQKSNRSQQIEKLFLTINY